RSEALALAGWRRGARLGGNSERFRAKALSHAAIRTRCSLASRRSRQPLRGPRPMARADPFAPRARYFAVDASFAYAPLPRPCSRLPLRSRRGRAMAAEGRAGDRGVARACRREVAPA